MRNKARTILQNKFTKKRRERSKYAQVHSCWIRKTSLSKPQSESQQGTNHKVYRYRSTREDLIQQTQERILLINSKLISQMVVGVFHKTIILVSILRSIANRLILLNITVSGNSIRKRDGKRYWTPARRISSSHKSRCNHNCTPSKKTLKHMMKSMRNNNQVSKDFKKSSY